MNISLFKTSGGGGTGGCVVTGPYEPKLFTATEFCYDSFESTDETDVTIDFAEPPGEPNLKYSNCEVVWVKRGGLPWFPGIVNFNIKV